ncbi:homoserine O-acetyltransferase [Phanerochaete sordida]|uniref:Homoserine O-acetyltransferase n=1 Tax=Phanerochaete sordida TaxID=48140 RepID=A0A9P3GAZ0_9APHY|nr:homoserine O-acetyltransferase [Phanerochaete sordida]
MSEETKYYQHGRFSFAGGSIPNAFTAYRTYGDSKNPCIVFPTCYGAKLDSQLYLVGAGKALDPAKYFIVTFALFSNGESSSPSNTPEPHNGPYFPAVSYEDNINAQYAVLTKELKVTKIKCAIGFSMGGQQAYHWAVMYPDFVEKFVPICGSARTSPHNQCFLEGPRIALSVSKDYNNGFYTTKPEQGVRAFARVYSAWAYGQTWYREFGHLYNGKYTDLNDFIRSEWEAGFLASWDANDMLTMLRTWQTGDVSKVKSVAPALQGDLAGVLSTISAKGLIMPSKTDLYFPPEDSQNEVAAMGANATLNVIDSIWGHKAGGGANAADTEFISKSVREFLESA